MAIDEFTAVVRAREFVRKVNPTSIPVTVEAYVNEIAAVIRPQDDLEPDEAGNSFESKGKYFICPNAKDSLERQRFTICHEVAHIKLKLPSQHQTLPWWSYAKRPLAEILCDVFAAELLLPYNLFKPEVENSAVNLADVENLADRFKTSLTATGSRFAAVISTPVAFVLSEKGKVRYASRSTQLKEAGAWIAPRLDLPEGSLSKKVRAGAANDGPEQVDADVWFTDWERGGALREEVRHVGQWDQTLTLLCFEGEQIPPRKIRNERGQFEAQEEDMESDDGLLGELDGHLRWPGKRRRR